LICGQKRKNRGGEFVATNSNNIIEFRNITKTFGAIKALDNVSFTIKRGEAHAIVGENGAGKTTLMNILSGLFVQDEGEVIYNGKAVKINSPSMAAELKISTVYQELKLCPNLTAVENIFLGRTQVTKIGTIKKTNMENQAKEVINSFGVDIDINTPVKNLSIAQMQIIEISKAIIKDASVIIFDEPTSSLTAAETDKLIEVIKRLREQGKTLIFISHRLSEIFRIADRISVLRDGKYIGTYQATEIDEEKVVKLIAGDKLFEEMYTPTDIKIEEVNRTDENVVLEVHKLNWSKYIKDVSFKLYKGEMLGIYGLQGAGRTELVETIFGLHKPSNGKIYIDGENRKIKNTRQAIKNGLGLITEDRKNRGIFMLMNIKDNICIIHNKLITILGFILNETKMENISKKYIKDLSIKTKDINQRITDLSGGNQQKVIISRILSTNPDIILADEPTKGIDVGAKAEIFRILRRLKKEEGKSIIVVSSELKEIVKECDRILVMRQGRIVGEIIEQENRESKILNYCFNG
jgi:ribose transport system ATP-binding protein